MSKDKNFERRMIVSKYSNRPPFDLKKPKESYDILDKIKEYPLEECKNCCRNRTGSSKNTLTKSNKTSEYLEEPSEQLPGKKIIPKILETFQKVSPPQDPEDLTMTKNTSIETLYRNTRSYKLGKNIPKHKLMRSLLQNLDSEIDSSKKCSTISRPRKEKSSPSKARVKYRKGVSKKHFFDKDEVVRTDFNVSCEKKVGSDEIVARAIKIDKKTSTTGLVWPPKSMEILQSSSALNNSQMSRKSSHKFNKHNRSSYSTVKEECVKNSGPQFSSNSFLEELPTKEVSQKILKPTASEKLARPNGFANNQIRQRSSEECTIHKSNACQRLQAFSEDRVEKIELKLDKYPKKSSPEKMKDKPKTFVQTQVEKLNKVMRPTRIPEPKLNRQQNYHVATQRRCEGVRERGQINSCNKREELSKYAGLMDRIRNNVPRIQKSDNYESYDSDHGWSDTTDTEIHPERIRFPKETKTAVDQRLSDKKMRIPLSKFTKVHGEVRPAFAPREQDHDKRRNENMLGASHKNTRNDFCIPPPPAEPPRQRKNNNNSKCLQEPIRKHTVSLPCRKNLLCDRGDHHTGSCRHSYAPNKVSY